MILGFKAFNSNLTGYGGYQFTEGGVFVQYGTLQPCANGFHFCLNPKNVDEYYYRFGTNSTSPDENTQYEYAIVEALGQTIHEQKKSVTNVIKIHKIISRTELESFFDNYSKENIIKFMNISGLKPIVQSTQSDLTVNTNYEIDCEFVLTVRSDGSKIYFKNNLLHRANDLPAIVLGNGDQQWWFEGKLHRVDDKPTVVYANGHQEWYIKGKRCKIWVQPALVYSN